MSQDKLRNLEEDLDGLHSGILIEDSLNKIKVVSGGEPLDLGDLHKGRHKAINSYKDTCKIEEFLEETQNQHIRLRHSPGAGGTTAALRAIGT